MLSSIANWLPYLQVGYYALPAHQHFSYIAFVTNDLQPMSPVNLITLHNAAAELTIDPFSGAITNFTVAGSTINPVSFAFTKEQMPENNREGAVYQGHFACIGRWGEASSSEKEKGVPNHGEPANILWQVVETNDSYVQMQVRAEKEGLEVKRLCILDDNAAVFLMQETVSNVNATGRPFNIVQHPTLAAPFLDEKTIIDCNATEGFNQSDYKNVTKHTLHWNEGEPAGLRLQQMNENAVYSFIVNKKDDYGWITAYSPTHKLLLGYVWKRTDYPWIHHWQHFNEEGIQYRGIEFGTAGIHQPYKEIVFTAPSLFGERTFEWLDAGEPTMKSYYGFILPFEKISGIKHIAVNELTIIAIPNEGEPIVINLSNNLANGLFK